MAPSGAESPSVLMPLTLAVTIPPLSSGTESASTLSLTLLGRFLLFSSRNKLTSVETSSSFGSEYRNSSQEYDSGNYTCPKKGEIGQWKIVKPNRIAIHYGLVPATAVDKRRSCDTRQQHFHNLPSLNHLWPIFLGIDRRYRLQVG